jgi:NitT/TauT family transport system permease protein
MITKAPFKMAVAHLGAVDALTRQMYAIGPAILTALTILLAWQVLVVYLQIPKILLPTPSDIIFTFVDQFPTLRRNALSTAFETVLSFLLAVFIGTAIASALSLSRILKEALYPYLVSIQVIPKIALAPLFTVWLSIGIESRLALAVFMSLFSIIISLMTGLMNSPHGPVQLARSLNASTMQIFRSIRFPYAVSYWFSGMRIASTTAVIGVVIGEFISSDAGLGYLILSAAARLDTAMVMAAILMLSFIGLAMYGAVVACESVVRRWIWSV